MRNLYLIIFAGVLLPLLVRSQNTGKLQYTSERCGQNEVEKRLIKGLSSAELERVVDAKRKLNKEAKTFYKRGTTNLPTLKIPIVFHIVHNNGAENINNAQVIEAVKQINEDYNARNIDLNDAEAEFRNIAANIGLEFHLAKRDPHGNPTNGITRQLSSFTQNGQNQMINELIHWPRDKYLNVWVVRSSDGANGSAFAYTPSTVIDRPVIDGVMSSHWAVGRTGTAVSTHYRILTHEIGHWLNLSHCWGNGASGEAACNDDDDVSDTPNTKGNSGCAAQTSCGSKDNYQNYMDYANCPVMFTEGQKSRMLAAINSSISDRNNLWTTKNLIETGVEQAPALAVFNQTKDIIKLGESVTYSDQSVSDLSSLNSWEWTFPGGTPTSFSGQNPPAIKYNQTGSYDVTLRVSNSNGTSHTKTVKNAIVVENYYPLKSGTVTVCDGVFYDSGLRGTHKDNEATVMTFKPQEQGKRLEFDFSEFSLENDDACEYDFLEVFNGSDVNAPLIGKFCGKVPPINLLADNNDGSITFRFTSDDNTTNWGWRADIFCRDANYETTDHVMATKKITTCSGKFFDSGKRVNYLDGENMVMTFIPVSGKGAMIVDFTSFHVEDDGCQWDYMQVFDGSDTLSSKIGKYCGTDSPGKITATNPSGALTFHFIADGNSNFPGWEAKLGCALTVNVEPIDFLSTVKVYPNPTKDVLTVGISNLFKSNDTYHLIINNELGQPVFSKKITAKNKKQTTENINISSLKKGIYILSITSDNGNIIKKIVKE